MRAERYFLVVADDNRRAVVAQGPSWPPTDGTQGIRAAKELWITATQVASELGDNKQGDRVIAQGAAWGQDLQPGEVQRNFATRLATLEGIRSSAAGSDLLHDIIVKANGGRL